MIFKCSVATETEKKKGEIVEERVEELLGRVGERENAVEKEGVGREKDKSSQLEEGMPIEEERRG